MDTKTCPECMSEIPQAATVCNCCRERIEGILCQECMALSPSRARVCRWCGNRLVAETERQAFEPFSTTSSAFGTFLTTLSLHPQEASFSQDKIVITTYGFLGLTSSDEEILWEKVAGFSHRSGIFWDAISIETRGQTSADITCLSREDSKKIRSILQGQKR
jgi:ribosomal protein L40E